MSLPLSAGPWKGVRNTTDPFDDSPDYLVSGTNLFVPDPAGGSGAYALPGWALLNSAGQLGSGGQGQRMFAHIAFDGTIYRFTFCGGKMYRWNSALGVATDVTPTTVSISSTSRVYCLTFADQLVVSDGVNAPWVASSLGSTPVIATLINYTEIVTLLSIGSTDTKVANAQQAFNIAGTLGTCAANAVGNSLPPGTVTTAKWAAYRLTCDTSGTVTVTAAPANYTTFYTTEALAIAGLPAVTPATQWDLGYFTVQRTGGNWIAGTDALQGGVSGNPASTTNYYSALANPWVAYGAPREYQGSLMWIVNTLNNVSSRLTLLWSEPNQPTVGYQQSGFADFWNLIQAGSDAIYAIWGTNTALYYWRSFSIGALSGTPSINFQGQATGDAISTSIGTRSPDCIGQYGEWIYFVDVSGKPYRFRVGGRLSETADASSWIWLNMRSVVDAAKTNTPDVTSTVCTAIIEPNLGLYMVAIWPETHGSLTSPRSWQMFDARTGMYVGSGQLLGGTNIDSFGFVYDANGMYCVCVIGSKAVSSSTGQSGYVWRLTNVSEAIWTQNGTVPTISATTQRLGYADNIVYLYDRATAVTLNTSPVQITALATNTASTIEGTPTPLTSQDSTYRVTVGFDGLQGRGCQLTLSPTTATTQWALERVTAFAAPCMAGPEDP